MVSRLSLTCAWLLFVVCLSTTSCFRSIDPTKVRCTSSDHCPSDFMCLAGACVSRSIGDGRDGGSPSDASWMSDDHPNGKDSGGLDAGVDLAVPDGADGVRKLDTAILDVASADVPLDTSSAEMPDVPAQGTGGAGGAGETSGTGGSVGSGGTGGRPGSGGAVGSGGLSGTGGSGTGGSGTGGSGGGGSLCQAKSRDCTSSLDNDCNGTPDNQETAYCACTVGATQACSSHPGYDGKGICKAGTQSCTASSDKTISSWGGCSGAVGPSTRNCSSSADNDCNGTADDQETAYCQCVAGATQSCKPATACSAGQQSCAASSDNTTTSWTSCTGYTVPMTMYRDADGDGYGNAAQSAQVCSGTAGYVSNSQDCDDADASFRPGVSLCNTVTQKKTCPSGGGTAVLQTCDQGCMSGNCRTDGTIGLPGYVSCDSSHNPKCSTAEGCEFDDAYGTCGVSASSAYHLYCDGPNDCPGQICCFFSVRGGAGSQCYTGACPQSYYYQVCDPLASASTCNCTLWSDDLPIYTCQ